MLLSVKKMIQTGNLTILSNTMDVLFVRRVLRLLQRGGRGGRDVGGDDGRSDGLVVFVRRSESCGRMQGLAGGGGRLGRPTSSQRPRPGQATSNHTTT